MRYITLVLAVALVAGTAEARADIVLYNMTGTITSALSPPPFNGDGAAYAVGDHLSWALWLDRTSPMTSSTSTSISYSQPTFAKIQVSLIPGIFDPAHGSANSFGTVATVQPITLSNSPAGHFSAGEIASNSQLALSLAVNGSLPSLNLANLQLNKIPFLLGKGSGSTISWQAPVPNAEGVEHLIGFTASVNSISGPVAYAPEPESLTLFLLGAAGLATRGLRRRLQVAMRS
ncbi:MAG TPA: hypothetical protein VH643_38740 [Gemmataceae bacterium]|jgi:hypothetical protein